MSRTTQIVLDLLGVFLVLCICAGAAGVFLFIRAGQALDEAMITDPQDAAEVGSRIADYDVPDGYTQSALSMLGFDMVMLTSEEQSDAFILMMQFPDNIDFDREQMEQQVRAQVNRQMGSVGLDLDPVEMRDMEIRGQPVRMQVSEGSSSEGVEYRQWLTVFQGKSGPTMLMISAPVERWDEQAMEAFVASLR